MPHERWGIKSEMVLVVKMVQPMKNQKVMAKRKVFFTAFRSFRFLKIFDYDV